MFNFYMHSFLHNKGLMSAVRLLDGVISDINAITEKSKKNK